jgi:hypothetical protein
MKIERHFAPQRMAWLGSLLALAAWLALGQLVTWQRGLYSDDIILYEEVQEQSLGVALHRRVCGEHPWPQARGLGHGIMVLLLATFPEGEGAVRLLLAALTGLNALLLAWLSWRLLRSPLAAWVTAVLFLTPTAAQQVCLWTCCVDYLLGMALTLGAVHASWHFLFGHSRLWLSGVITTACLILTLLMKESFLAIYALLPAVLFLGWRQSDRMMTLKGWARRTLLCLAVPALLSLGIVAVNYVACPPVALTGRGGTITSGAELGERVRAYATTLQQRYLGQGAGQFFVAPLDGGWQEIQDSRLALACMALALLGVFMTTLKWPVPQTSASRPAFLGVALLGGAWFVLALLFPNVLVKYQGVTPRMLYFPCAGLALLAGAASAALAHRCHKPLLERGLALAWGIVGVLLALSMLGYAQQYAARSQEDQRQRQEFERAIPVRSLPPGTLLVHVQAPSYCARWRPPLGTNFLGVLDSDQLLQKHAARAWGRTDLQWLVLSPQDTTHGLPWRWAGLDAVVIAGRQVPLTHLVVFFYEPDSGLWLLAHLTLPDEEGRLQRRALPAVAASHAPKRGTDTIQDGSSHIRR